MKKKYLIIIGFVMFWSLCLLSFKLNNESTKNIIGVYINDEYSYSIPAKDSGYYVDKIECDNGSLGEWNYTDWGLLTTNMSKKSKCNIYFKEDTIINSIKDELDTTGKCPSVNSDGTVNVTSAESENSLLCSAPDNYGTSYYYRGNVSNNYVYFAGYYFRIVRINGDGSIRLIYDGTTHHENGEVSEDRIIGYSAFNEKCDDNAYVGYMYGTPGSSTYEETHANINDSTIKKYVDNWYENNLKDTKYEEYISDNIFCNDRRISKIGDSYYTNEGYSNISTRYRWSSGPWIISSGNHTMMLKCVQNNDAFTSKDKISGNASLSYSIGLITSDEVVLAGAWNISNTKYYLYAGFNYWNISAYRFENTKNESFVRYVSFEGDNYYANSVKSIYGVKPVINLKQGSLKSGDGTKDNPYKTN